MPTLRFLAMVTLAAISILIVFLLKLAWTQPPPAQRVRATR
jgi:hypothetical protein